MSMASGSPDKQPETETETGTGMEAEADARERERRKQAQQERPRMNIQQIHSWVDLEIEQALRRGEFDNLPGAGKPLKNVEQNDPDWWVKGLIEREKLDLSSALPTVMALRQERRGFPESLAGISDEVAVRERLEDYNARVIEDRRKPVVGPNPPAIAGRVDIEEMVQRWRLLREDRTRPLSESLGAETPAVTTERERAGRGSWGPMVTLLLVLAIALVGVLWAVL